MRKNNDLVLSIDDCCTTAEIIESATRLLKKSGCKQLAEEMNNRIDNAKNVEEVFEILDEYVEIE